MWDQEIHKRRNKSLDTIVNRRDSPVICVPYVSRPHLSVCLVYRILPVKSDFCDTLEGTVYGIATLIHLPYGTGQWSCAESTSPGRDPVPIRNYVFSFRNTEDNMKCEQ